MAEDTDAAALMGHAFEHMCVLKNKAERTKAIRCLVFMCRCPIVEFVRLSLGSLEELSAEQVHRPQLIQWGAVKSISQLCTGSQDNEVLARCGAVLSNLAQHKAADLHITMKLAVAPLVCLINLNAEPTVVAGAVQSACNLSRHNKCRPQLVQEGIVKAIVQVCNVTADDGVLLHAAELLQQLTEHSPSRPHAVEDGAARTLVQLCANSQDIRVLRFATAALVNLAQHAPSRMRIIGDGAIRPLSQMCGSLDDDAILRSCADVVGALGKSEECRAALLVQGALPPLVQLLALTTATAGSARIIRSAASALAQLAVDPVLLKAVLEAGTVTALAQLCGPTELAGALQGLLKRVTAEEEGGPAAAAVDASSSSVSRKKNRNKGKGKGKGKGQGGGHADGADDDGGGGDDGDASTANECCAARLLALSEVCRALCVLAADPRSAKVPPLLPTHSLILLL